MGHTSESERFDVLAFGAHPDDLEVVLGGTAAKLVRSGLTVLFVDLCDGEPARHAIRGVRQRQADQAATILGVRRATLPLRDRFIRDSPEARLAVARLIRQHKPRLVFTTAGAGVHPGPRRRHRHRRERCLLRPAAEMGRSDRRRGTRRDRAA